MSLKEGSLVDDFIRKSFKRDFSILVLLVPVTIFVRHPDIDVKL